MNRAQQILNSVFEARPRKKVVPAVPAESKPLMTPDEMQSFVLTGLNYGNLIHMRTMIEKYSLDVHGRVNRTSSHHAHENTVEFTWEVDAYDSNAIPPEEYELIGKLADKLQDEIGEEVKDISKKIYRALETAYEDSVSEEVVADNLRANEYTFNEYGKRTDDGELNDDGEPQPIFQYDQLEDSAKETAREWYVTGRSDDSFYAESVLDEWKVELEKIGFENPEISYSGFWSQGDGASFTCSSFNFTKYANFFLAGRHTDRGRPYTDDLYAEEYKREAEARQAAWQPPVAESDLDIDMAQFIRNSIHVDFSSIGPLDTEHQRMEAPWERHYAAKKMSRDGKMYLRLDIYDAVNDGTDGTVRVELYVQAWDIAEPPAPFSRKSAGQVSRKVKFFVPSGEKSKLVATLLDYWVNAKVNADRRDAQGKIKNSQTVCRSLAHRLSVLAGLWKKEHEAAYNNHLDAVTKKWIADNPERFAQIQARRSEWIAKHPEPSEEKLKLRAEMKKWKAERDAVVPPPPAQESEDSDLLSRMGIAAIRATVDSIGGIMHEQPVSYMSGAKQYTWSKVTPDWAHKVRANVTIYSESLPDQPWDIIIGVSRGAGGANWRIDHSVAAESEKNYFGINVVKLIPMLQQIVADAGPTPEALISRIESAFNETLGLSGESAEHFYTY